MGYKYYYYCEYCRKECQQKRKSFRDYVEILTGIGMRYGVTETFENDLYNGKYGIEAQCLVQQTEKTDIRIERKRKAIQCRNCFFIETGDVITITADGINHELPLKCSKCGSTSYVVDPPICPKCKRNMVWYFNGLWD